jgi:hypothetical protein
LNHEGHEGHEGHEDFTCGAARREIFLVTFVPPWTALPRCSLSPQRHCERSEAIHLDAQRRIAAALRASR